ncbi:MAG: hypothetical protein GX660_26195 [Clostridiaceae bacterium]|nr:hypothetical protein [Clostridiaceae bacterium]
MNALQTTYNEIVKTQRFEVESGSDIEGYEDYILSVPCLIQELDDYSTEDVDGSFGKNYLMFCDDYDIKEMDNVMRGNGDEFRVIGMKKHAFMNHVHLEVIIRKND